VIGFHGILAGNSRMELDIPSGYLTVRHGKYPFLTSKPSINGPFHMAMLNNQRVIRVMVYILMGCDLACDDSHEDSGIPTQLPPLH
jgi:hypothetical protein